MFSTLESEYSPGTATAPSISTKLVYESVTGLASTISPSFKIKFLKFWISTSSIFLFKPLILLMKILSLKPKEAIPPVYLIKSLIFSSFCVSKMPVVLNSPLTKTLFS